MDISGRGRGVWRKHLGILISLPQKVGEQKHWVGKESPHREGDEAVSEEVF